MKKYLRIHSTFLLLAGLASPLPLMAQDLAPNLEDGIRAKSFAMNEGVETATGFPKPISQVAENVTIITAEEIQRMNAHTASEVLDRMAGVYMATFGRDFGSTGRISLQGSDFDQVLILVDGIDWNHIVYGTSNIRTIPVAIIKRIEVIKGPGSSTWGSSLGGVVNIITKDAGAENITGTVSTSFGEKNSTDSRVELQGTTGPAAYYLFAGKQRSDGLRNDRNFDNHMLYGKAKVTFTPDFSLQLTSGYSEPHLNFGNSVRSDTLDDGVYRAFWTTLSADMSLSDTLSLNTLVYSYDQKRVVHENENGTDGPVGDLYYNEINDEKKRGLSTRLIWQQDYHTLVSGIEYLRGELDYFEKNGDYGVAQFGAPPVWSNFGAVDETAFYVNDTIVLGAFTITPGIRYDRNSVADSFTSSSLGLTYQLNDTTILRGQVAQGFNMPALYLTTTGLSWIDSNPALDVEKVTSMQAGFETWALKYLWLKATYFDHDVKDAIALTTNPATGNDIGVNVNRQRRQGFEIEAKTISFHNFNLQGDFSYVHLEEYGSAANKAQYTSNMALLYEKNTFFAGLYGHYIWYDQASDNDANDFVWDVNISKRVSLSESLEMDIFASAHNIFNGTQENDIDAPSVERWLEAGLRFSF